MICFCMYAYLCYVLDIYKVNFEFSFKRFTVVLYICFMFIYCLWIVNILYEPKSDNYLRIIGIKENYSLEIK